MINIAILPASRCISPSSHGRSLQSVHYLLNAHPRRDQLLPTRGTDLPNILGLFRPAGLWHRRATATGSRPLLCPAVKSVSPFPRALSPSDPRNKLYTSSATGPSSGCSCSDITCSVRESPRKSVILVRDAVSNLSRTPVNLTWNIPEVDPTQNNRDTLHPQVQSHLPYISRTKGTHSRTETQRA